jgi:hypothetical protein
MTPERFKIARSLSLPVDFEGHSTHGAPATARALGEALDEIERLTARMVDYQKDGVCFECFSDANEADGQEPGADRPDEYVSGCAFCGHEMRRI